MAEKEIKSKEKVAKELADFMKDSGYNLMVRPEFIGRDDGTYSIVVRSFLQEVKDEPVVEPISPATEVKE